MARIRTIKPEFFTSEDIVSLSPLARLLYVALWCEADREGRLNWKPRTLKMKYLPAESCDVMPICNELVSANLVVPYIADEEPYAVLPSFKKHQAINVREAQSSIPAPPDGVHVHARAKDAWAVDADTRVTVLARDAHKCVRCGSNEHLQIDHIFPKSMGGTNAITNLRVLCRSCNAGRPVSGQGLIDDLAQDGLTLGDMQRTCMHVQGNGEGKGREGKGKEGITLRVVDASGYPGFDQFWEAWPSNDRKQAKGKCLDAWKKASAERDAALVLSHVNTLKNSQSWTKDGGQFVPAPLVYLNNRRWEGAELAQSDLPAFAGGF